MKTFQRPIQLDGKRNDSDSTSHFFMGFEEIPAKYFNNLVYRRTIWYIYFVDFNCPAFRHYKFNGDVGHRSTPFAEDLPALEENKVFSIN